MKQLNTQSAGAPGHLPLQVLHHRLFFGDLDARVTVEDLVQQGGSRAGKADQKYRCIL